MRIARRGRGALIELLITVGYRLMLKLLVTAGRCERRSVVATGRREHLMSGCAKSMCSGRDDIQYRNPCALRCNLPSSSSARTSRRRLDGGRRGEEKGKGREGRMIEHALVLFISDLQVD